MVDISSPSVVSNTPDAEVIDICQRLVRIDSSNYGANGARGETEVADVVAELLAEIGVTSTRYSAVEGRPCLVADWVPEGTDTSRPFLLLHGHSDVVPAAAEDWTVDPFSGEIRDGFLWGRGTLDMKDFLAMILSAIRARHRRGEVPSRPIRFILFADEEGSGDLGSTWMGQNHPEVFDGVTEAISEVGGFSLPTPSGKRAYVVQSAEKGLWWFRMKATGLAGHGSMHNPNNAVTRLAAAVNRIAGHQWPDLRHPVQEEFLARAAELWNLTIDRDNVERSLAPLGPLALMAGSGCTNMVTPTVLDAGYKANVIPSRATAELDARFIPGHEDEMIATIKELAGEGIEFETISTKPSVEAPWRGTAVDAITSALQAEDDGAVVLPFLNPAGTDGKGFGELPNGRHIDCYGCTPLRLPEDFEFLSLFHGVDERVPLDALQFGARVVDRILEES